MFFVLAVHRIPLQEGVTMFEYTVDWAINVSLNVQTLSLSLSPRIVIFSFGYLVAGGPHTRPQPFDWYLPGITRRDAIEF